MTRYVSLFLISCGFAFAVTSKPTVLLQGKWQNTQTLPPIGTIHRCDLANSALADTDLGRIAADRGDSRATGRYVDAALAALRQIAWQTASPSPFVTVQTESETIPGGQAADRASSVAIDIDSMQDRLQSARVDLNRKDLSGAREQLVLAGYGVARVSVSASRPLLDVEYDLADARKLVSQGKYDSARQALELAAGSLYDYRAVNPARAGEAAGLSRKVGYFASILSGPKDAVERQLDLWHHRIAQWLPTYYRPVSESPHSEGLTPAGSGY